MDPPPFIARYRREVEAFLRDFLDRERVPLLTRMVRYHLGWEDAEGRPAEAGGKGLRGALCLLACQAVSGDYRRALHAAAAIELVHNFSLVHDDIQDRDRERHHRPTVWAIWGEAQGINAGDALLVLARLALLRAREQDAAADLVLDAARYLDERTLEMVEGQVLDLSYEAEQSVDLQSYLDMISKKSAALLDCTLYLGALFGSADRAVAASFAYCGRRLGRGFQVRDDILDVWGTEKTGKPIGADIQRGKKSLPIVYLLSRPGAAPGTPAFTTAGEAKKALEGSDARGFCERIAADELSGALALLEGLGLPSERLPELRQAAEFLVKRDY